MKIMLRRFSSKGSASFEAVMMCAALAVAAYAMVAITGLVIGSERALISANGAIWQRLAGMDTPCLETVATGEFEGGTAAEETGDILIGIGGARKNYNIERKVTFKVGDICN
jgi:hypothetical protein